MHVMGDEEECPNCGFRRDMTQNSPYLPLRSVVCGRYLLGKILDKSSDGVSYIGWDLSAKIPVTVREYFPASIADRATNSNNIIVRHGEEDVFVECMAKFKKLWSKLLNCTGNSAMIDIYDIFEENNTVYAVYEYVDSITLREYLLRTPTGYISWDKARALFMPVLSTLGKLHQSGVIHRGISPTTLIFDTEGKLRITGFCIADARSKRGALDAQLFSGYSAIEQYGLDEQQGPWTDVYSFAAVLYRALIGSDPIDAKSRVNNDRLMIPGKFAEQLPAYVINGLINALQIFPDDRTRTVEQCRAELSAAPSATMSLEQEESFDNISSRMNGGDKTAAIAAMAATMASAKGREAEQNDMDINDDADDLEYDAPETEEYSGYDGQDGYDDVDSDIREQDFYRENEEYEPDKSRKKKKKGRSVASQVLIGALSVFVVVGILFFVLSYTGVIKFDVNSGEKESTTYDLVQVPNFVNRIYEGNNNLASISSNEEFKKHFVFAVTYEYSDTLESGIVISQDIKAGTAVSDHSTIHLVISKGKQPIKLTNVENMTYDAAVELLSKAGFVVEMDTITQPNDGSHTAYTVYKMSPGSLNKTYDKGTKVVLTVWGEVQTETTTIEIPDITVPQEESTDVTQAENQED